MKRHAEQIGWLAETSSGGCTASDLLPHPAASAASDLSTLQHGAGGRHPSVRYHRGVHHAPAV